MMKPMLICLIGIDGSGKTTQAKLLDQYLRSKGEKSTYIYGRYIPILSRPIVRAGALILEHRTSKMNRKDDFLTYTKGKKRLLGRKPVAILMEAIILFEYSIQIILKIRLPMIGSRTVICDRYVYDTVATDLAPDLGYDNRRIIHAINRLLRIAPTPQLLVYLKIDPSIANSRKQDVPHLEYLKERATVYDFIATETRAFIINADRDREEIHRDLIELLGGSVLENK